MKKYEFLEHPADIKIRSFGNNLTELFTNSALGMMAFLYGKDVEETTITNIEKVKIQAGDLESLLIDWLSELLYLSNSNYRAYVNYDFKKLNENELLVEVSSGRADAQDDIKAVTYHDLSINKNNNRYEATVVYDI